MLFGSIWQFADVHVPACYPVAVDFLRLCLHSIIFCEAVAIYGIIVAIILQTKIDWVPPSPDTGLWSNESYLAGYAIFASGLTTGWANLACGCASGCMHAPGGVMAVFSSNCWRPYPGLDHCRCLLATVSLLRRAGCALALWVAQQRSQTPRTRRCSSRFLWLKFLAAPLASSG